ncbi:MAG: hypothetical protein JJ899_08850 [Alphaproteobacteria bacterium]|nr:hypothetical protein [Alphaproteobacteria bacterium]
MRKFTIAAAALSLAIGLGAGGAQADNKRDRDHGGSRNHVERHAHSDHYERRGGYHRDHDRGYRRGRMEIVSVRLHRRYAHETIPLRRLLELDGAYRGYKVREVTVVLRPHRSRGPLALVANGEVVDRARPREGRVLRLTPDDDRTLGRDLRRLQLDVRGRAFIDRIDVKLRAPRGYHAVSDRDDHKSEADRKREALAKLFGLIVLGGLSADATR